MRELFEKPLTDWEWTDIEALISNEVEETQYFEFKETLPSRDGNIDPWQNGRSRVSDYARDTIAEEIAAFANAYGGILIVGVEETNDNPARARAFGSLVRDCADCVARLEPAIRSRFDPPLQGLEVRAIPRPDGNREGALLFRTPSSSLAPHGVGRPPVCYVRRGTVAEPATMRDLQNMFWETRARNERVREIQAERRRALHSIVQKKQEGGLYSRYTRKNIDRDARFLAFRCTAIPLQSLGLRGVAGDLTRKPLARPVFRNTSVSPIFGSGPMSYGWRPKAHGAQAEEGDEYSLWTISDEGVVEAAGLSISERHYPGWFALAVAQVLVMAHQLRNRAGRPDIPFSVDCEFLHDGYARVHLPPGQSPTMDAPDENVRIGPYLVERRADLPTVFGEIEREIWFGLGVPDTYHARFKPDDLFSWG